jgi:FkbM family methyltransferase
MDQLFVNFINVLKYFTPLSYLDVGACKGHAIPYIIDRLPSINKAEMIEACTLHEDDLKQVSLTYNIPYKIEVLSDEIKEVDFYLNGLGKTSTGPGNSYYKEDTPHYNDKPVEKRITNTLDNIYDETESFDLIKMDTQGSELDIIKGGLRLISKAKGIILEENIVPFNFGAPLHDEIKSYMESIGFILVDILDDKNYGIQNSKLEHVPHHEIDTLYIRKDLLNEK